MGWDKNADTAAHKIVGRQVQEVRDRRGLSQAELADRVNDLVGAGWHQTTVAKVEKGQRQLDVRALLFVAAALDVSPLHLIVPRDDTATLSITGEHEVTAREARAWIRGSEPLPGMDDRVFRTEVPDPEWREAQQPSKEEVTAREWYQRARRQWRIAEAKVTLIEDKRQQESPLSLGDIARWERRAEKAWQDFAAAEVDLDDAEARYRAVQQARGEEG